MLKKVGCVILALIMVLSLGIVSLVTASADSGDGLYVYTDDKVYNPQVGDIITYKIDLQASRLFENCQVTILYDSTKLKVVREPDYDPEVDVWGESEWPLRCPNLENVILNLNTAGCISFNDSKVAGINFKEEKNLFNVRFEVIDEGLAVIRLNIAEMWIKGGEEAYFRADKNAPVVTEGIFINEYVANMEQCTDYPEKPTEFTTPTTPVIPSVSQHPDDTGYTTRLYFYADEDWSDILYCYSYNKSNEPNGPWPGTECKYEGYGVFSVDVPGTAAYIIFNDGVEQVLDLPVPNESQVAVFTGLYMQNTASIDVRIYEWQGIELLDEVMNPDYVRPTIPVVKPTYPEYTYPDAEATPDEVWPEEPWDTLPTEPCETAPCETEPCVTEPCETAPVVTESADAQDKPQSNQPATDPTAIIKTDETSAVEDSDKLPADTVATGESQIIIAAGMLITVALISFAVAVKKRSYR